MTTVKIIFRSFLILSALHLACASANAQQQAAQPPYRGPVYLPPEGARPLIKIKITTIPGDGDDIRQYRLVSEFFPFIMSEPQNWAVRNDGKSSISYQLRWDPSVRFLINLYPKKEFLPDVTEESIKGYIEGLKRKYKANVNVLNDDGSYLPENQNTDPLDRFDNKMVIFTITDSKTEITTKYYENLLVFNDVLIVATLKGPPETVGDQPMEIFTRHYWSAYPVTE